MTDELDDDRPWGEDEWERFMRESETRSARFGELLETLMDHPDRDAIIRREMGWDKRDDAEPDEMPEWKAEAFEAMNEPPTEEDFEEANREQDDLEKIPAYSRGFAWSIAVRDALEGEYEKLDGDLAERLAEAIGDSSIVAAKIAAGHGMGYDDESICGNIVCCKWSLEAANRCLDAMRELKHAQPALSDALAPLLMEGEEVKGFVEDRIAELRECVWWE